MSLFKTLGIHILQSLAFSFDDWKSTGINKETLQPKHSRALKYTSFQPKYSRGLKYMSL